jgi:hypothetical protein
VYASRATGLNWKIAMPVPPDAGIEGEIVGHPGQVARPVRTDFKIITVNEFLGNNPSEINTDFPFVGRQSSLKTFQISGVPVDDAYLLLTHSPIGYAGNIIKINNRDLPWIDIFASSEDSTHLKTIPPGYLVRGVNTLQVFLNGPGFILFYLVVHWREQEPPPPRPPALP